MTARPQENVVNNIALLPLPDVFYDAYDNCVDEDVLAYASANVTAALASAQAREDELRAEVERLTGVVRGMANEIADRKHRAERLEDALRYALNQNEHDMVLTGDEIRADRAALSTNAATQTGETT